MNWVLFKVESPEETEVYVKSPHFTTWDLDKARKFKTKLKALDFAKENNLIGYAAKEIVDPRLERFIEIELPLLTRGVFGEEG